MLVKQALIIHEIIAFRFPATIPEAPGHYSAPSSPPHDQPVAANTNNTNAISGSGSAVARSNMHHHHQPYRPALHHTHRRRSLLTEEGPVLARRASMPVVGYVEPPPPPTSQDKPMRKSDTPYSRSPELRVSHKLAERKRRKEMKELFDELRDSLPVEKNLKTSKWEILSKGKMKKVMLMISVIVNLYLQPSAVEYISLLKRRDFDMESETNALRREVNMLRRERG